MRRAAILAIVCAACASSDDRGPPPAGGGPDGPATASLWNQAPASLFGNRRAREVGDILTLIVEIDEGAQIGRQVEAGRSNARSFGVGALFGLPQAAAGRLPGGAGLEEAVDLSGSAQRSGGGSVERQDRVTLRLAARVTDRLANGDLVVEGHQAVRVGRETRVLHASGVVRPEDISRANTITHDRMAEAEIAYGGKGALDRAGRARFGDRLLDAILPF